MGARPGHARDGGPSGRGASPRVGILVAPRVSRAPAFDETTPPGAASPRAAGRAARSLRQQVGITLLQTHAEGPVRRITAYSSISGMVTLFLSVMRNANLLYS